MANTKAFTVRLDPSGNFSKYLRDAIKSVKDLRIPLELIRESWFKSNRAIFALKSNGGWPDLTTAYKKQKLAKFGFVYPMLQREGLLRQALTIPGNENSVSKIIERRTINLGVDEEKVPYFSHLNWGTKRGLKPRPYILLGAEQVAPRDPAFNTRVKVWQRMITDYVIDVVGATGG